MYTRTKIANSNSNIVTQSQRIISDDETNSLGNQNIISLVRKRNLYVFLAYTRSDKSIKVEIITRVINLNTKAKNMLVLAAKLCDFNKKSGDMITLRTKYIFR